MPDYSARDLSEINKNSAASLKKTKEVADNIKQITRLTSESLQVLKQMHLTLAAAMEQMNIALSQLNTAAQEDSNKENN